MYQGRIKTPFDLIKQPWLDFERSLSFVLYLFLKRVLTARNRPVVVNKILLIRRNRLGDAVNVLPLIQGIKQFHPQVKIHVLASRYNAAIFRCCPHVDKVHSIDEKWLLGKATLFMHPVVLDLRHESFDLVIGLGGYSSVLAQLVLWVKGKFTVGMLSKKGTFYDLAFDRGVTELGTADKHHVEDMAHIVRTAGLLLPDRLPDSRMLSNSSVKRENWLAICPDVKRVESRYPITKYADVIEQLLRGNEVEKIILFTENSKSPYLELEKYGAQCCPTSVVLRFSWSRVGDWRG